jgi:hypothetical protein
MDKKTSERIHAKRRALERYGLNFTKAIRNQIKGKIQSNGGTFLYRRSRRVTVWEVDHENKKFKVVYDTLRGEIVTFLPQEQEETRSQNG